MSTANNGGAVQSVPLSSLHVSTFNPRKSFPPETLTELAKSILANGIQQSLLVRPKKNGNGKTAAFEVVAGERRYRALQILLKGGSIGPDAPVPVIVKELPDPEALLAALLENLQREDLHPLEEAESFNRFLQTMGGADLTGKTFLADKIGKSVRHVELRLALLKLAKPARAAFEKGTINTAQARILAPLDKERQESLLEEIESGWMENTEDLAFAAREDMAPVAAALFPIEAYKGDFIDGDSDDEQRFFTDLAQFERLQAAAIKAKVAELLKTWAWVEVAPNYFHEHDYTPSKDKTVAGAIIELKNGQAAPHIHEGWVKRSKSAAGGGSGTKTKAGAAPKAKAPHEQFTQGHLEICKRLKTEALQNEIAKRPLLAVRLAALALMGGGSCVNIKAEPNGPSNLGVAAGVAVGLQALKEKHGLPGTTGEAGLPLRLAGYSDQTREKEAKAWEGLRDLGDDDALAVLAHLVAARCGTFNQWKGELGDAPVATMLAEELGIDMRQRYAADEAFLAGAGKPALIALIQSRGLAIVANAEGKGIQNMTLKALRQVLLDNPLPDVAELEDLPPAPPTVTFGSFKALAKRLGEWMENPEAAPAPAAPARKPAAAAKKATKDKAATAAPRAGRPGKKAAAAGPKKTKAKAPKSLAKAHKKKK